MAAAAVPLLIGGTLLNAFGAYKEGEAAYEAHQYNAKVARENAKVARDQGAEEERRVRVQGRKVLGDIRANYGASGITGGSALDVLADSAANAEMDALTVRRNSEIRAYQFDQEAEMESRGASSSRTMGRISAAASLLGGAGSIAGRR